MKWIKLFEEFDDSNMSITAFFEELGLEGEYENASLDDLNFYTFEVPAEKHDLLIETFEVLKHRLSDHNMSAISTMCLNKKITIITYDRRNLAGTIEKWLQEVHRRMVGWVEDQDGEDYKQELINEIEIVDSIKVDSVITNSFDKSMLFTDVFKVNKPPLHVRLNIDYGKGPDGIWYSDLEHYIRELKWGLVAMLHVELGLPERSLQIFEIEKINI